jgi:D-2-hydroxyacid dehydrogenase (NADP+)
MLRQDMLVVADLPPPIRAIYGEETVRRLQGAHPRVRVEIAETPEQLADRLPEADGVFLGGGSRVPVSALRPGGRLRWVHFFSAGVDGVLTPELIAAEHVVITASKGPMAPLMAEHAVLLMLALARDLPGYLQDQAERRWRYGVDERPAVELVGKTILILGVGEVGGYLARICKLGLGMRVLGLSRTRRDNPHVDRYVAREDLPAALAEADVVTLCLARTAATEKIIDAAALRTMKPTALLVNVARGRLVDEVALIEALRAGRLGGAGLDATTVEPLPPESPLWTLPRVIITPHVSAETDRVMAHLTDFWCENLRRFAKGEALLGVVSRHEGY